MDPELWDLLDICPVCGWPRPDACECPGGGDYNGEWSNQVREEDLLRQAYDAKQRWLEAEEHLATYRRNYPEATETLDLLLQVTKDSYQAWKEAEKRLTK